MISVLLGVFFVGLIIGLPVALTMLSASIIPNLIDPGFSANIQFVMRGIFSGANSTPILAVPLFMLSGAIMAKGGISKKLFDVFAYAFGRVTAGMPCAVIITCLFYGAISGSGPATTAAVGGMTIPILLELGYDKRFCGAIVGTAGGLGVIIPPSIPFILYGLATGTSVGMLFTAGIIPGFVIAFCLMGYAVYYCKKYGEDKEKIAASNRALRARGLGKILIDSFWALMTPVIILGGIYSGITTPTEAACISVFYALFVSLFIYRSIRGRDLWGLIMESVRSYAPLCMMLALATVLGRVMTLMNIPAAIAEFITLNFASKVLFLLALDVILLVVGMFMDCAPAILILAPMLLPTATALGINPVHLGIIMVVNLAIGFITPPFGVNLFVASRLIDVPVIDLGKKVIPFVIWFLGALLLITFIEPLSLILL